MCGYCVESSILLPTVEQWRLSGEETFSDLAFNVPLMEATDIVSAIHLASPDDQDTFQIALCRFYDHSLRTGFAARIWCEIEAHFSDLITEHAFEPITRYLPPGCLDLLGCSTTYRSEAGWQQLLASSDDLAGQCTNVLNRYYHWWHKGHGRLAPRDRASLPETERKRFKALVPAVYFSLHALHKLIPGAAPIELLANSVPSVTPDSDGEDLWLQRTATTLMADAKGTVYLAKGMRRPGRRPRLTAIYYALLQANPSEFDLRLVKREAANALTQNGPPININGIAVNLPDYAEERGLADIVDLVDRLLA